MSFETEFRNHLVADSSITALVNSRVFPITLPEQVTLPAIVYTPISGAPENSLLGFDSQLIRYDLQIDCWANRYTGVIALGLAIRNRLQTDAATFRSIVDQYPLLDDYEEDTKIYRRAIGIVCWFRG